MFQHYTSPYLTHFVGAGKEGKPKPTPQKQYDALRTILHDKCLKFDKEHPQRSPGITTRGDVPASTGDRFPVTCVCFCDIPLDGNLRIHMNKYSRFGLSFRRSHLVSMGANPVWYIANDSIPNRMSLLLPETMQGKPTQLPQSTYLDTLFSTLFLYANRYLDSLCVTTTHTSSQAQQLRGLLDTGWTLCEELNRHVIPFFKFFDSSKGDEDQKNYYMEREWRILDKLQFKWDDIAYLLLPERFLNTFRTDFPTIGIRVKTAENVLRRRTPLL